jgi:predicted HNH restriction endonuclease
MKKYFLFSMDEKKYNLEEELKYDYVDWILNRCKNATKGDMVYIYVGAPYSGIKFCAEVKKTYDKDSVKHVRLINFKHVKNEFQDDLKLNELIEKGHLFNAPRGKQEIKKKDFLDLIQKDYLFESIDNSEEKNRVIDFQTEIEAIKEPQITQIEYSKDKNIRKQLLEKNGYIYPERDNKQINLGLLIANRQCEYDNNHKSFIKQNGEKYAEAHHLIPFSRWEDFNNAGLDIAENIICLCSECHNQIHYGQNKVKIAMLKFFFDKRKAMLKGKDLDVSFEKLLEYYKLKKEDISI